MALHQRAFDILVSLAPCRLLSLGVPDLLLSKPEDAPEVHNADTLRKMHGWTGPICQADEVFKQHGIEATYLDVKRRVGSEFVMDLNQDYSRHMTLGDIEFDVVLDPGTLEHCFNIGQAFVNVRNLCRPGGHILHLNPMNFPNHGFFSISPTAYCDWYAHHNDDILVLEAFLDGKHEPVTKPHTARQAPFRTHNLVLVKRSDEPTLGKGWPTQWKFLHGRLVGEERTDK